MVNAQKWLDENYPLNRRNEISGLDISKGKIKRWDGHERTLKGSLNLEGFTNLRELVVSFQQITSLNVNRLQYLTELNCQNNQINNLNVNGCSSLKKINCSNNYLGELDLSTCFELEEVNINNCSNLNIETIKSDLNYDAEIGKLLKSGSQIRKAGESDIRNILIIGITGNGKSALANTLSNTKDFMEGNTSTSATKSFQTSNIFEWKGKKYRVIDNIGFGDTNNISEEDVLFEIGKGIHVAKEGINQILFVFSGRFSPNHLASFNIFKDLIRTDVTKFTTLVRTNFSSFRNKAKCKEDLRHLLDNRELKEITNYCNGIVYIDNPPIVKEYSDDSENEREKNKKRTKLNEEKRKESREIVLSHLAGNCKEIYKLKEWDSIYTMVENYSEKKEQTEKTDVLHKNILIVGKTGSGKSSLSNVLLSKDNNFKEVFAEGDGSASKTRKTQPEEVETNGSKYRIIDTIGFGDTSLSEDYLLNKSKELFDLLKEGINQILLVNDSKMFTKEEIFAFNFLKKYVFGEDMGKYTTIIRTNFRNFQILKEVHEDLKRTIREDNNAIDLIRSCRDIIYVDNPSININSTDERNEEEKEDKEIEIKQNLKKKEESKKMLLDCLNSCKEIYELRKILKVREGITELDISKESLEGLLT